eukprot:jgi/Picsp_1/431/NSC_00429-R1_---NA---
MDEDEDLNELRVAYDPSASGSHRSTVPPAGQFIPNKKKRQRRYAVRKHLQQDVSLEGLGDGGERDGHRMLEDIDQEVLLAFDKVGNLESSSQPDVSGSQNTPHCHSEVYTSRRREVLGSLRKMLVPVGADSTSSPIETQQHPLGVDTDMLAAYNAHMASRTGIDSAKKISTVEKSPSRGGRRRMSTPGGRGQRHRRIPLPSPLGTAPPFSVTQSRSVAPSGISASEIEMETTKESVQMQFLTNIPAPARTNASRFRSRLPTTLAKQADTAEERIRNSMDGSPSFLMVRVESHEMEMGKMKCFCHFVDASSHLITGKLFLIADPTPAITSFLESDAQEKDIIIESPWLHLNGFEDELPLIVSLGEISQVQK